MNGGCTVVIDPRGRVRYAIFKRLDSDRRRARQQAAMRGPLKAFWQKSRGRWILRSEMLRRLHALTR